MNILLVADYRTCRYATIGGRPGCSDQVKAGASNSRAPVHARRSFNGSQPGLNVLKVNGAIGASIKRRDDI